MIPKPVVPNKLLMCYRRYTELLPYKYLYGNSSMYTTMYTTIKPYKNVSLYYVIASVTIETVLLYSNFIMSKALATV